MEIEFIALKVLYALIMVSVVMGLCSYSVLAERKVSSLIHGRVGPNRTSLPIISWIPFFGPILTRLGLFQPIADGLKFLFKEEFTPAHVNKIYYFLAPVLAFVPAMTVMVVLPFGQYQDAVTGEIIPLVLANLDVGILFTFAISSLGVYGIVLGGWASNSKYPLLGSIRSGAQMISFELTMGLSVLPVFIWANPASASEAIGGLSLFNVVLSQQMWNIIWQPLSALIFLIALFAETNRTPFDMAESETDLVGGFHTEYGCFRFGLFFVSEYAHMILGSGVFVALFLGGANSLLPFGLDSLFPFQDVLTVGLSGAIFSVFCFLAKTLFFVFFFIWVRWTIPRFRYDQVMKLGWNILLPIAIGNFIFNVLLIGLWDSL